jgi:hypothetical protein
MVSKATAKPAENRSQDVNRLMISKDIAQALPATKAVDFWADPVSMVHEQIRTRLKEVQPLVQQHAQNKDKVNKSIL